MKRWAAVVLGAVLAAPGCKPKLSEDEDPLRPPVRPGETSCRVRESHDRPLIVEWPMGDRGTLETNLREGLVVVHYEGCEMRMVHGCTVNGGRYRYAGFTRKRDALRMASADELYAELPLVAASLEATPRARTIASGTT